MIDNTWHRTYSALLGALCFFDQGATKHLTNRGFGQFSAEFKDTRHFEISQILLTKCLEFVCRNRVTVVRDDVGGHRIITALFVRPKPQNPERNK